jgi:hypothetical protein
MRRNGGAPHAHVRGALQLHSLCCPQRKELRAEVVVAFGGGGGGAPAPRIRYTCRIGGLARPGRVGRGGCDVMVTRQRILC